MNEEASRMTIEAEEARERARRLQEAKDALIAAAKAAVSEMTYHENCHRFVSLTSAAHALIEAEEANG